MQLVNREFLVVYRLPIMQICCVGMQLKPAFVFTNSEVLGLGLAAAFLLTATNGKLIYSKGAATLKLPLPLLLADAAVGDIIELDEGRSGETIRKIRAIKKMRSTGVAGKPATVGATLRFVLKEHAPVVLAAAGGGV